MKILAEDHPFPLPDGDGGIQHPPLEIMGRLTASLEKNSKISDPLLEKQISILFFDQERDFPFLN
jgi:hypothetical protein